MSKSRRPVIIVHYHRPNLVIQVSSSINIVQNCHPLVSSSKYHRPLSSSRYHSPLLSSKYRRPNIIIIIIAIRYYRPTSRHSKFSPIIVVQVSSSKSCRPSLVVQVSSSIIVLIQISSSKYHCPLTSSRIVIHYCRPNLVVRYYRPNLVIQISSSLASSRHPKPPSKYYRRPKLSLIIAIIRYLVIHNRSPEAVSIIVIIQYLAIPSRVQISSSNYHRGIVVIQVSPPIYTIHVKPSSNNLAIQMSYTTAHSYPPKSSYEKCSPG